MEVKRQELGLESQRKLLFAFVLKSVFSYEIRGKHGVLGGSSGRLLGTRTTTRSWPFGWMEQPDGSLSSLTEPRCRVRRQWILDRQVGDVSPWTAPNL